jgi:AcrR family transcriptional regulator
VFATQGPGAPIDAVARQAGLGVGTLYRHFPTKEALFEAIVLGRLEQLVEEARSRLEAADPGSALFSFLARFFEQVLETKALSGALASAGVDVQAKRHSELWRELWQQLLSTTGTLLARAQRAGLVRPDVGVDDLMALCTGTSHAMDQFGGACSAQRILAVVCDGLRVARAKGAARRDPRADRRAAPVSRSRS